LALGFGRNPNEAAIHAWGSILGGFERAKKMYLHGWDNWLKTLHNLSGKNLKTSSAVLRMHEAKSFPGGVIASLSIPWGETKGDTNKGGYHVVWPRDLVESAGGFMALKAEEDTLRILNYLMSTQKVDGSWPQNMWLEGAPHWKGMQMDQTALPIVLTCQCFDSKYIDKHVMHRYWPIIKKALSYLIKHGPYTEEDRWEEEKGYSPFTLAAEIASLLSGADLADANGEKEFGEYCREKADDWNDQIEAWTYVTGTSLSKKYDVDGYYIRINPFRDIVANQLGDRTIDLKNHHNGKGKTKISELVSVDALSLVRFGLRSADDPKIVNTVKVIDAMLKVDTPNGACWHRYNNDGYGEHKNGDSYDGTGIGRAWPLLTGERAHFEIANNNLDEANILLQAMEAFANNGLLSEQIWDTEDIADKELYFGEHSGSAMPLTWAHAEYIKLCASIKAKKIFDMPPQTQHRYLKLKKKSDFQTWRFEKKLKTLEPGKSLRIEVMAKAAVKWTDDEWKTSHTNETIDTGIEIFITDIKPLKETVSKIEFTFYWEKSAHWENHNYIVEINKR
ncbi:MAG: glycoside hydrolase family 15 protein, partial [Ginsengibacter sp.]